MVKWLNHVAIAAPRNGTTTHAVDPSSGTVVSGTLFTPTAGRFLVCFSGGSVTSTTPSGWTLPTGGNVAANGGLYVWYREAAGGDTITTTHNGSNYPCVFDIYEFPAGTTFIQVAGAGTVSANGGAGPSLSGLTASANFRCAAVNQNISGATAPTFTWSNGTEAVDTGTIATGGTDGYGFSLTYLEDQVGATYSSAATSTITFTSCERLVVAFNVPAGTPSGSSVETISLTDLAAGARAPAGSVGELLNLGDTADGLAPTVGVNEGSVSESLSLSESVTGSRLAQGLASDSASLTDSAIGLVLYRGTIAETAQLGENANGQAAMSGIAHDSAVLGDAADGSMPAQGSATEVIDIGDHADSGSTPTFAIGSEAAEIYVGSETVDKVYLGSTLLYDAAG